MPGLTAPSRVNPLSYVSHLYTRSVPPIPGLTSPPPHPDRVSSLLPGSGADSPPVSGRNSRCGTESKHGSEEFLPQSKYYPEGRLQIPRRRFTNCVYYFNFTFAKGIRRAERGEREEATCSLGGLRRPVRGRHCSRPPPSPSARFPNTDTNAPALLPLLWSLSPRCILPPPPAPFPPLRSLFLPLAPSPLNPRGHSPSLLTLLPPATASALSPSSSTPS